MNNIISMIDSFASIKVSAGFGSFNEGVTKPDGQEPYADSLLHTLGVNAKKCAVFGQVETRCIRLLIMATSY